ncbi:hypothetical protein ACFYU9_07065 [Streptomyces sp. NPDC004327]|uniref:hypothetical protein n=1 Tax=Streptomyces sp. NPDC004327 TaxID=3364699 RepID=UPI0036B5C46B
MMTRIARGLAGTALVMALAATAACGGGGDEGGGSTDTPEAADTSTANPEPDGTPQPDSTLGATFPGKTGGGKSAAITVPTSKVGKPTGGKVAVHNASHEPMNIVAPETTTDNPDMGDGAADLGSCTGTLAPGEECALDFQFTPYQEGSYSGTLSYQTSQGETVSVPFSGEAVSDTSTETGTPEPTPPSDTGTDTPEPTPSTETPEPSSQEPEPDLS